MLTGIIRKTVFALLLLSGCVSPEEQQRQFREKCAGYGYREGTDAMANCIQAENRAFEANLRPLSDVTDPLRGYQ
jgi:hypothetical protein